MSGASEELIGKSTCIGLKSDIYTNGYEYFCSYKDNIYYIIDDGTTTGMLDPGKPKQISNKEALHTLRKIIKDESKLQLALEILDISDTVFATCGQ